MSGAVTLNGVRVVSGTITVPFYGAWVADVVLSDSTTIAQDVSMSVADLTLTGTIVRQASFAASRSARIVGGAAGWRKSLPSRGYSHLAGVKLSSVVSDAASECGETIALDADRSLGTHYARDDGKAERVLELEIGGAWWIDHAGTTQTKSRDASPIVTPFTVVSWSGGKGQFEIASETIAPWQPGRTFTAPTVEGTQTISSVTYEVDNDGKMRLHVLSTNGSKDRLRESLRDLIRQELGAVSYVGVYEYVIGVSLGLGLVSTIDATPTDPRMPPLTGVPIFGTGIVAAPIAGTKCRIRFVNGDPTRPECISIGDSTEHVVTVEACVLLVYNTLVALMAAAGGGPLIAAVLQPLLGAALTAALGAQAAPAPPGLIAQVAAAAAVQAGFAAGTTPSPAMFAAWTTAIAALSTKTLDVSGAFPSVGVPNG